MQPSLALMWVFVAIGCASGSREAIAQPSPPLIGTPWQSGAEPLSEGSLPQVQPQVQPPPAEEEENPLGPINAAAQRASPGGRRVLEAARAMIDHQVVLRGSCYRWVNAVFHRAGGRSRTVFQGSPRQPAATSLLRQGDWVFFINHSYDDVTHSAIFVAWIDESAHQALMVSYPGGNRDAPGRMSEYELTNVYRLARMDDNPQAAHRRH